MTGSYCNQSNPFVGSSFNFLLDIFTMEYLDCAQK